MQPPPPNYSTPPNYSNYYRPPSYGRGYSTPPGAPEVSFEALSQAWNLNFKEIGIWVPICFIYGLIAAVISYAFSILGALIVTGSIIRSPYGGPSSWNNFITQQLELLPFSLIAAGFIMPLTAGLLNTVYRRMAGEPVSVGDIFQGFSRFGQLFIVGVVTVILQWIGFLLLIIPGFYLYGALAFAPIICLRDNKTAFEAVHSSMETLRGGRAFFMFLLLLVAGLASLLGALACCIGVIFTVPIYFLTIGISYYNFFPPQPSQMPQQPYGAPVPPYEPRPGYGMTPPPSAEYPGYPPQAYPGAQPPGAPQAAEPEPAQSPQAEDQGGESHSPESCCLKTKRNFPLIVASKQNVTLRVCTIHL